MAEQYIKNKARKEEETLSQFRLGLLHQTILPRNQSYMQNHFTIIQGKSIVITLCAHQSIECRIKAVFVNNGVC